MKKNLWLISSLALAGVMLGACGESNHKETINSSTEVSRVEESNELNQAVEKSVIKGILKEDVTVDGTNSHFFLGEIEGVDDPTDIAKGIGDEGVILNAESQQVVGEFKEEAFKAGQAVEVTLNSQAIMTRSMPPQIPSVSIISIKKL